MTTVPCVLMASASVKRQAHRLDADLNPRRIFAGGDRDGRDVELAAGVGP
jgi:hypothetical protein